MSSLNIWPESNLDLIEAHSWKFKCTITSHLCNWLKISQSTLSHPISSTERPLQWMTPMTTTNLTILQFKKILYPAFHHQIPIKISQKNVPENLHFQVFPDFPLSNSASFPQHNPPLKLSTPHQWLHLHNHHQHQQQHLPLPNLCTLQT